MATLLCLAARVWTELLSLAALISVAAAAWLHCCGYTDVRLPLGGRLCVADLRCVTTLLSVAATMSFYNLSLPYVGLYRCRLFFSAPDTLTTPLFASAHVYMSEKAWRVDIMRNTQKGDDR